MDFFFTPASVSHIRLERSRARILRQSLWWRQKIGPGVCYHCGQKFPKELLTMDHLVPLVRGGKSTKKNIVVSCKSCNSTKGYLTQEELALRGEV